jgi:hypothetical protein
VGRGISSGDRERERGEGVNGEGAGKCRMVYDMKWITLMITIITVLK